MIYQKNKGKEESLAKPDGKNKLKKNAGISQLLTNAINKYQYDVVGWTEFCIDNKNLKQKTLPKYREKPLENLRLQERNLSSIYTPPLKTVFSSQDTYITHLDKEYIRDQAFYEAILKNPGKYRANIDDNLLNEEIDRSAKKYLKNIKKRKIDEKVIINSLKTEDWVEIKKSKYPKVLLGLILGVSKEAIINNFGLYFINQLKAEFSGSRTAYLSSSGPSSWHEIDRIEKELAYFKKEVVEPIIKKLKKEK
jgi:hypothetical protein